MISALIYVSIQPIWYVLLTIGRRRLCSAGNFYEDYLVLSFSIEIPNILTIRNLRYTYKTLLPEPPYPNTNPQIVNS